jgi:two-component system chemotaxis sensor kinase CheA
MDVVKKNIEKLNGTLEVDTLPGRSTRIRIKIPLTLAIIPALLVRVLDELFTIPLSVVDETLRVFKDEISVIEGVDVMYLRDETIPLIRLREVFKMSARAEMAEKFFVVIVNTGEKRVGLIVDHMLGQEEVVIKPLEDYLQENSGFSGATILGDGQISLILDVYELIKLSTDKQARRQAS